MSSTLIVVVCSIVLLFLIFPFLFFYRRRVELRLENDILVLEYPLSTKRIDLDRELLSWKVEKAYYIRWGIFYSINMHFKNGKRVTVSSLLNNENYNRLYDHLSIRYDDRRKFE